ncbi:MAG: hypothetical protein Kow0069_14220 [Promethearchaeota archaeon]
MSEMSKKDRMKLHRLSKMVENFTNTNPDVAGAVVIAYPEGVPLANSYQQALDPILLGAVSASVRLTFQHLCDNLRLGRLRRLFINSEGGRMIIQNAGDNAILTTIVDKFANLYGEAFKANDLSLKIGGLLKGFKYA